MFKSGFDAEERTMCLEMSKQILESVSQFNSKTNMHPNEAGVRVKTKMSNKSMGMVNPK